MSFITDASRLLWRLWWCHMRAKYGDTAEVVALYFGVIIFGLIGFVALIVSTLRGEP